MRAGIFSTRERFTAEGRGEKSSVQSLGRGLWAISGWLGLSEAKPRSFVVGPTVAWSRCDRDSVTAVRKGVAGRKRAGGLLLPTDRLWNRFRPLRGEFF